MEGRVITHEKYGENVIESLEEVHSNIICPDNTGFYGPKLGQIEELEYKTEQLQKIQYKILSTLSDTSIRQILRLGEPTHE